jgi:hypothetical protein
MHPLSCARTCAIFFLCACFPFSALAQETAATPPANSQYPESEKGLKSLITDILTAMKSGDAQKSAQLLGSLSLPNHNEFFLKSFGAPEAARLEAKYVELEVKAPDWLQKRLEGVAKHSTQTDVTVKFLRDR